MQGPCGTRVPNFDVVRSSTQSKNKGRGSEKSRGREEGWTKFERREQAIQGGRSLHKIGKVWNPLNTLTLYYCMVFKYLSLYVFLSIYQHHSSLSLIYIYIYIYVLYIHIYICIYVLHIYTNLPVNSMVRLPHIYKHIY